MRPLAVQRPLQFDAERVIMALAMDVAGKGARRPILSRGSRCDPLESHLIKYLLFAARRREEHGAGKRILSSAKKSEQSHRTPTGIVSIGAGFWSNEYCPCPGKETHAEPISFTEYRDRRLRTGVRPRCRPRELGPTPGRPRCDRLQLDLEALEVGARVCDPARPDPDHPQPFHREESRLERILGDE
jgi:hypothetical protein